MIFHANGMKRWDTKQTLKKCKKETKKNVHNFKNVNPRRGYNNFNCLYTNIGSPKYLKQILEGEMQSNTTIFWDFNAPLTSFDRSSIQKINK